MTLEQVKMLKLVVEEESLKAAGEKIHKTQAAVSQGIKQLESHLGIQLFNRNQYRLCLTPEGERVYQAGLMLLEKADEIEDLCKFFSGGNETTITLTFDVAFDLNLVLDALEELQATFPDTQIIIRQEYITGALDALNRGEADIIITPVIGATLYQPQYESFLLFQNGVIRAATPKLLARYPNLQSVKELGKEYQIIVQDSGSGTKGVTYNVEGGQRRWYVNDVGTKKMLIMRGLGWGSFTTHMIADEIKSGRLKKLELPDAMADIQLNHYVIKQRGKLLGPVASHLWDSLKALAEGGFGPSQK